MAQAGIGHTRTRVAEGAIREYRFVDSGTADTQVAESNATGSYIGIHQEGTLADGDDCRFVAYGFAKLKLGGTVGAGAFVESDANGQGIAAASTDRFGALALHDGENGDIIEVIVTHGSM